MLGKLSVALLIAAAPAVAQEAPAGSEGAETPAPEPVAYKTKKICRTIEVVGSSIPKRTCSTKRIPFKPPVEGEAVADADPAPQPKSPL